MAIPGGASPVNLAMALQPKVGALPAQQQFIPPVPTAPAQPSLGVQLVKPPMPALPTAPVAPVAPTAQPSNGITKGQLSQRMQKNPYGDGQYWGNS